MKATRAELKFRIPGTRRGGWIGIEDQDAGCFTQTLNPLRLREKLNKEARGGWRFAKSIHEEKKVLGIFSREAHSRHWLRAGDRL